MGREIKRTKKKTYEFFFHIIIVFVFFNDLFQRNKLNTYNDKHNYHIMIIQHIYFNVLSSYR